MNHLTAQLDNSPEAPDEDSLQRLLNLANEFKAKKLQLEHLEAEVKASKKEFNTLSQELIPQSMQKLGMSSFMLETGESISFKEEVSVSVKDYDALADFLDERGDSSILKITMEIGKVPKDILSKITQMLAEQFGIFTEAKQFVHPQTIKSYVKNLCGINGTEAEMALSEIDEGMLKTYLFYKTTVK